MLRSPRRIALWAIVVIACIVPLWSALLGRTQMFAGDMTLSHAPWNQVNLADRAGTSPMSDFVDWQLGYQEIARDRAWSGDLAEWDELSGAGAPLMSIPHTGMYSPLGWVTWIVPPEYSPGLLKAIEFAVSIGGMFLLGRLIGLSTAASLVGGATYAFSGFQIVWSTSHQSFTGALIPWVFWASERLVRRRRWIDVVPLALATAVMALGGFMAVSAYALYAAAAYLVLRALYIALSERGVSALRRVEGIGRLVAEHGRDALRWGVGVGLGIGAIAVLMIPYLSVLTNDVLPDRGGRAVPLPEMLVSTLAFPHSFGVINRNDWFGPSNAVEGVGYVGAAALLLALLAVVTVRWNRPGSAVVIPTTLVLAVFLLVTYTDLPVISYVADLPGISGSLRGRMRSINGFLIAVLAAVGADVLIRRSRSLRRWERMVPVGAAGAGALVAVFLLHDFAAERGQWAGISRWILVDLVAMALVAALIVFSGRGVLARRVAPFALVTVVCVEALFMVVPYLPRTDPSLSMQETAAHRFLQDTVAGDERTVSNKLDLYPGTTRYYGIPSLTGHFWHTETFEEYLQALDPDAFAASRTFSQIDLTERDRIHSPLLDRAAVRYAVLDLVHPVPGRVSEPIPLQPTSSGEFVTTVTDGHLRGFTFAFGDGVSFPDGVRRADLRVELTDRSGRTTASKRRYFAEILPGDTTVPFLGEDIEDGEHRLRVWLEDPRTGGTLDMDVASVRTVVAVDDGLRLVHVSGVAIWERETAFDRYRWAQSAVVETDPDRGLEMLADGDIAGDEVLLNTSTHHVGGPGEILAVEETDVDHRTVTVRSESGGWLVVADTLQSGWSATIDGEGATLHDADHAFVAVWVPPGEHDVVLDYQAPGTTPGRAVSVLAVVALGGIVVSDRRRHRGSRP